MTMLGYEYKDVVDMIAALQLSLAKMDQSENKWMFTNVWKAKDLLEGLVVENWLM